ncbi:MAG: nitrilase-related carbon-nitrogen hydrolase [bacterium]
MKLKVGVLQFNPVYKNPERNYQVIENYLSEARDCLIVLPELCTTGYLFEDKSELFDLAETIPNGKFVEILSNLSKRNNLLIVAGIAEKYNEELYNSAVVISPSGFVGKYRKINLFYKEKFVFSPGNLIETFDIEFCGQSFKLGVMICFDWFFPEVSRVLRLKGAKIIAHPANLVLPYCPLAMPIRALENKLYTITANRIGHEQSDKDQLTFIGQSVICSPKAEYLLKLSDKQEGLFTIDIDLEKIDNQITKFNNLDDDLSFLREVLCMSSM